MSYLYLSIFKYTIIFPFIHNVICDKPDVHDRRNVDKSCCLKVHVLDTKEWMLDGAGDKIRF